MQNADTYLNIQSVIKCVRRKFVESVCGCINAAVNNTTEAQCCP